MPTSVSVLHHEVLLSNYVQHWTPPKENWFLADEFFPTLRVDKESNLYKKINQSTFQQTAETVIGPDGDVAEVQYYLDPDGQYRCKAHGLEGVIDHYDRSRADDVVLYEQLQTDVPMVVLKNSLELEAFTRLRSTANLGTSYKVLNGDELFDNYASLISNPVLELRRACERIISQIGRKPNKVSIDFLVWRAIQFNPAVQAIAPVHTTPAGLQHINPKMLEEKLQDVLEPNSIRITFGRRETKRGPQQGAKKSWAGPDIVIAYLEEPSLKSVGACHCFAFAGDNTGDGAGAGDPIAVYSYPDPKRGADGSTVVRVRTNRDYQIVKTESLFVLKNVVDYADADLYGTDLEAVA
jgi:hypothetical protein